MSRNHERKSPVTPYLIAGIGAFRESTASSTLSIGTEETSCCTASSASITETIAETDYSTGTAYGAYEDFGGGASLYLNPHWGIRAEGRIIRLMTTSSTNSSVLTTTTLGTSTATGTTIVGGPAGDVVSAPATNDDFRAALSIFYRWGGPKTKQ